MTTPPDNYGQLSPDREWWWDGQNWQPAVSPDGRRRWNGRAWQPVGGNGRTLWLSLLRWGLTGIAALVGGVLILGGALGVTQARLPTLVRIDGQLTDAQMKGSGDYYAHLRGNQYCFRIFPDDFSPALPRLDSYVGQAVSVYVDQGVYPGDGIVGDPFCNFQVVKMSLATAADSRTTYVTDAAVKPEAFGHTKDDSMGLLIQGIVVALAVLAINIGIGIWRRRRRSP